ncbi:peroxiredoxin family protein [Mahella australiensis]|uniref:Alkyl hydroperoxide reductase/ Thiol specific antioxidant/ Mal allergen n=1 Tax=Mahella australiensis (strain DSM 15567 / CIP 107919 / 50-1 BON) TaxID=697281 RepID=F3ZYF7_MAHA5|nr:TlpA disulfide reductase family protein [Mahella australiensis]AEE96699.1 alkyl hydroperoxide reductase/ Thiol specific antioxidant/ Mal allergen [Mahella australiensis 50-1 BON]
MKWRNLKNILLITIIIAVTVSGCSSGSNPISQDITDKQNDIDTQSPQEQTETPATEGNTDNQTALKEALLEGMMDIPIEDFELEDLNGDKIKLSDYKGKIVLLNFWATWCPPCREEMPYFQEIYEEYKDYDVVVLTVNSTSVELRGGTDSEQAEKNARKFMEDNGYTFPVLLDKDDEVWAIYQQRGIPANYIIDKDGIVRYAFGGAYPNKEQIIQYIENIRAIE